MFHPKDLSQIAVEELVGLINVGHYYLVNKLKDGDKRKVTTGLDSNIPLGTAISLNLDDTYWHKRCLNDFPAPHFALREQSLARGDSPSSNVTGHSDVTGTHSRDARDARKDIESLRSVNALRAAESEDWKEVYLTATLTAAISGRKLKSVRNPVDGRLQVFSQEQMRELLNLCRNVVRKLDVPATPPENPSSDYDESWLERIVEVMKFLKNLKVLKLVLRPRFPNEKILASAKISPFVAALQASNIEQLSLTHSGLTDEELSSFGSSLGSLSSLSLSYNLLQMHSALFTESPSLTTLVMVNNLIDETGSQCLSEVLPLFPNLKNLFLDGNPLKTRGVLNILNSLPAAVEVVSMSGVRAGEEAGGEDGEEAVLWRLVETMVERLYYLNLLANSFSTVPSPNQKEIYRNSNCSLYLSTKLIFQGIKTIPIPDEIRQIIPNGGGIECSKHSKYNMKISPPDTPLDLDTIKLTDEHFELEKQLKSLCIFSKEVK